jgi:uncharacterized membrane protein YfcA
MFVGSENVGIVRSTRSLSGATGMWAGTAGCGIVVAVAPVAVAPPEAEPDPLAPVGEAASLLLVQAAVTSATATIIPSRRGPIDWSRGVGPWCPFIPPPSSGIGSGQSSFEPS